MRETEAFNATKTITQQMSPDIDFGYCPVGIKTTKVFKLHNYYDHKVNFKFQGTWFAIEPLEGTIDPGRSCFISISCLNDQAKVIVAKTILQVSGEHFALIKLSVIFKYPHIQLQKQFLDFGDVLMTERKELTC